MYKLIILILYIQIKIIHAEQDPAFRTYPSVDKIGFALPSTRVSVRGIATEIDTSTYSTAIVVGIYSALTSVMYLFCLFFFFGLYYKKNNWDNDSADDTVTNRSGRVKEYIKAHFQLVAGTTVIAAFSVSLELIIKFVRFILWTCYIGGGTASFLIVWFPFIFFIFFVITPNLIIHGYYIRPQFIRHRDHLKTDRMYYGWMILYEKRYVHAILLLFVFLYLLIYASFPTFILLFAYPTKMIAVVAFVLAFLFSMIIFFCGS